MPPPVPPQIRARIGAHIAAEATRHQRFGQVRPIIHADFKNQKLVAVGDKVFFNQKWKTFPDFLLAYIKHALGSGWGQAELRKPLVDRHPVMQWFHQCADTQKGLQPGPDGLYGVTMDGITAAFLLLSYDLYVLDDHQKLQTEVLRRLRRPDQFFGARYELFVAATFIRAGFDIEYEDERDSSRKHPEFIATHKATKFTMAVEAKAKHRSISSASVERPTIGIAGLLRSAAKKQTPLPYCVFVEVNMPPEDFGSQAPTWMAEADETVTTVVRREGRNPFDLLMFTNTPHHYGAPGEPDPQRTVRVLKTAKIPSEIDHALATALSQYGNVPQDFPDQIAE